MTLIKCPECGHTISEQAVLCPQCGYGRGRILCYEYRSKRQLWGLPLVHILYGPNIDPVTGKLRIAKGIIAIGNISIGLIALGGISAGLISIGGLALGGIAIGGCAFGILAALGGLAVGSIALGGCAVGLIAIGGAAIGIHSLGGNNQSPELLNWFQALFRR